MKDQDRMNDLALIRGLMERSTRFLSLSGLSGVIAGTLALGGALLAQRYMHERSLREGYPLEDGARAGTDGYLDHVLFLGGVALAVLVLSLASAAYFTWRRGRRIGQGFWDPAAERLLINLLIPLAAGGIFCIALLYYGIPGLVPSATLIFYGLALVNASRYTLDEIRWLGLSELVLGLLSAFWVGAGLMFWALGFGVLHIFYGGMMYLRHERCTTENR